MYALPNITTAVANSEQNSDRPIPNSAENKTFTLDALLRQAKVEGNDCEIHLEFSDTSATNAKRAIVEIPPDPDVKSDYQMILRLIHARFPHRQLKPDSAFVFPTPIPMKVTGFAFFDGVHKAMAGPHRPNGGHGSAQVKTFWELHPAWNVDCPSCP